MHTYQVVARFQKGRTFKRTEEWTGDARHMVSAMRQASKAIMRRKTVVRLRHQTVTFTIEKLNEKK